MNSEPTVTARLVRTVHAYSELWLASQSALEAGETAGPGSSSRLYLSSLVLTAFAFEAYLNHAGAAVLHSWHCVERIRWEEKLQLLSELLPTALPSSKGERPLQTICELFTFRNSVAHGRNQRLKAEARKVAADAVDEWFDQHPLTDWERLVKDSLFARRAREDCGEVITLIHQARPHPKEAIFSLGVKTGSATIEKTQ